MIKWQDTSSYERGERHDPEPRSVEANVAWLRIILVRTHIDFRGQWVLRCYQIPGMSLRPLNVVSLTEAKALAVALIQDKLKEALDALGAT